MTKLSDHFHTAAGLEGRPVVELLLLVGDESKGCKQEALDMLLERDFDTLYPTLERGVRNNALADLRNGAMEVLVHFGRKSIPRLVELLQDGDEEVRNFSTVMLGDIASRDAVPHLIAALNDQDANVRHGAAEALGRIGDSAALLPLLKLLREDFWQQYPVLAAIREMRDNRAVPYLLPLIHDTMLGEPAIEALAAIGDCRALPSLLALLEASSPHSAALVQAIYAICTGEARGENKAASHSPRCNKILEQASVREILHRFAERSEDEATAMAARALLDMRQATLPLSYAGTIPTDTTKCSNHERNVDASVLAAIRTAITEIEAGIPLDTVLLHAKSACDGGEGAIIEAIGRMGNCKGIEALLVQLGKGNNPPHVEFAIVHALCNAGSCKPVAASGLIPFTTHPDPDVRRLALHALTSLDATTALPILAQAVKDPHWSVRLEALRLLPGVDDDQAVAALLSALDDTDLLVRKNAVTGLGRVGSMNAVVPLVNLLCDKEVGRGAFEALLALGEGALPLICPFVDSGSQELRERIIDLVGRYGSRASIPLLRGLADDPGPAIRLAVIHSFWNCHDSSVHPLLARLSDSDPDPDVRHAATVIKAGLERETER